MSERVGMTRKELIAKGRHTYITQREAADLIGCTDRTIRTMISDGRLKAYRFGARMIRLRLDEVQSSPMVMCTYP